MPDDLIQVIDEGWAPSFWDGEEDCSGPVCPDCVEKYLDINHPSGELVLKDLRGEYVSEWASGKEYRCPCKVNMHTRRIEILELFDATEEGELVREYVIISGKEYTTASFRSRDEFIREDRADMFFWG
jgi:hypothetical protein